MRTALEQVRAEMGRDAVILQSRSVRGRGIWAWLGRGRRWVEVTAAWDGPDPGSGREAPTGAGSPGPALASAPARAPVPARSPVPQAAAGDSPVPPGGLRIDVAVGEGPLVPPPGGAPAPAGHPRAVQGPRPEPVAGTAQLEGARWPQAVHAAQGPAPLRDGPPASAVGPLRFPPAGRPLAGVVAVLGPTGAGKTTTVAKLAARAVLDEGRDVALLAADTYRLGATRSLAAYAELLGLPLAVAYSPGEAAAWVAGLPWEEPGGGLARAAAAPVVAASRGIAGTTAGDEAPEPHAGDRGPAGPGAQPVLPSGGAGGGPLALVDTAGRNLLLPEVAAELATLLSAVRPWRVLLVVPATLAPAEAAALVAVGRQLGATDLVLTKLDECLDPAAALSRAARWGLPLALVGCGQRVPDDLLPGTQQVLASWLGARPGQVAGTGGGSGHGFSGTGAG